MVPKESGFNLLPYNAHAHGDVFQARLPSWEEMVKLNKAAFLSSRRHSLPFKVRLCKQPNCAERLHVDATIMRSFQT